MVNWIKATLRSVNTDKGYCPISSINAKWNVSDKVADMPHVQATWGWLYDNLDIHALNMPIF